MCGGPVVGKSAFSVDEGIWFKDEFWMAAPTDAVAQGSQ